MTRRRSLQQLLKTENQKNRWKESDIQHRIYVRPLGNTGQHIVKSRPDGAEYQVSGPQRTFKPRQVVPTGRHTGTQGEVILIEPPPGKEGPATSPTTVTQPPLPDLEEWYTHYVIGTAAGYRQEVFHQFGLIDGTEDPYPAPENAFLYVIDGLDENGSPDPTAFSLLSFEPFNATSYKMTIVPREGYTGNADSTQAIPPAVRIAFNDQNGIFLGAAWHYTNVA